MNNNSIETLINHGYSDEEIASELNLSAFVVQEHRENQIGFEQEENEEYSFLENSVIDW